MKLCIPTADDGGLEAPVHGHFGSAPWFTLLDTFTGEMTTLPNGNAHHAHGTCHPLSQLAGRDLDALVVGGIGRRALDGLHAAGLKVFKAPGARVKDVVLAAGDDALKELEAVHACGGHGHGSRSHGHGCHD